MSRRKKRQKNKAKARRTSGEPIQRVPGFDVLRGIAIALMIVDHLSWLFYDDAIEPYTIRFFTRLAMPLFCVLSGYLASTKKTDLGWEGFRWKRFSQILLAAIAVNVVSYANVGKLEILASFCLVHLAVGFLGKHSPWLCLCLLVYPWEPTLPLFDFPVTVVATSVAFGALMQRMGWRWSLAGASLCVGALWGVYGIRGEHAWVEAPTVYALYFLPLAVSMVGWVQIRNPRLGRLPWLGWIGKYPLTCYVAQYWILLSVHWLMTRSG